MWEQQQIIYGLYEWVELDGMSLKLDELSLRSHGNQKPAIILELDLGLIHLPID